MDARERHGIREGVTSWLGLWRFLSERSQMIDLTSMPPFLAELLGEIASADPLAFCPPRAVRPDETVVGAVHPWTQKIAALYFFYCKEVEQAKLDHKFSSESSCDTDHPRIQKAEMKMNLLEQLMWCCCREEFSLWEQCSIGMRKEWKFVRFEPKPPEIADILRQLFER
jgi:hypothetical protein